jgi:hypothetical protein
VGGHGFLDRDRCEGGDGRRRRSPLQISPPAALLQKPLAADLERFFRGGEAELELVETYTSVHLVVLVVMERQHGAVGGLPEQDWSLRVTWVFRREGEEWR